MDKRLEQYLFDTFPNLYGGRDDPQSLLKFGFACGNGWFPLLFRVSWELERAILLIPQETRSNFRAVQIKEKFATLRFYFSLANERMVTAIRKAEVESSKTCEKCGAVARVRKGGWWRTLCDLCWVEQQCKDKTPEETALFFDAIHRGEVLEENEDE